MSMATSRCGIRLPGGVLLRSPTTSRSLACLCSSPETPGAFGATDFAVSYLVSSCGLSPKVAAKSAASSKLSFTSPEKPDAVLRFLRSSGFTEDDISRLVTQFPLILYYDVDGNIKPKVEFYKQLGMNPGSKFPRARSFHWLFTTSLERQRLNLDSLTAALDCSSEVVAKALRRWPPLLCHDFEERVLPNLETLQEFGLLASTIHMLVTRYPTVLVRSQDKLVKILEHLKEMGFNPSSKNFGHALAVLNGLKASSWDRKLRSFRDLGWKDEEMMLAFKKQPHVMAMSEEKVKEKVWFYREKLGWDKDYLLVHPSLLGLSLEKRLMPRLSVLDILQSRGELERGIAAADFMCSKETFAKKFVLKYADKYPELLDAYKMEEGSNSVTKAEKNNCTRHVFQTRILIRLQR